MPLSVMQTPSMTVDVTIIGSGIQGLWSLATLTEAGYNAILLERERPGFGQTGHSHVFLHEGHMFASSVDKEFDEVRPRLEATKKANAIWKTALNDGWLRDLDTIESNFYVGWQLEQRGRTFQSYCHRAGLTCDEVAQEGDLFQGIPPMGGVYHGPGKCIDSRILLERLLAVHDIRSRVGFCKDIDILTSDSSQTELLVTGKGEAGSNSSRSKDQIVIKTNSLILSAGAGNERLISLLNGSGSFHVETSRQQTVKTFMLVVRHLNSSEPLASGFFPEFGGIFMVSRRDLQGKIVWLIGDKQRKLIPVPGESPAFDAVNWFGNLNRHLVNLLPRIANNPDEYEWGIYEATKAERWTTNSKGEAGRMPEAFHVSRHPSKSIWLTWPTLLTFAPLVAASIRDDLVATAAPQQPVSDLEHWQRLRLDLNAADCRWKRTPLVSWTKFNQSFGAH